MPSCNRKKRSKQRAECLQNQDDILSQENRAKTRARYKADPEKKKASVRDSYKADPEKKKASVRDSYKADPEKKKASVRDSYKADPEKKKASVRDSYKADPEKKKASVLDSYKADPEKKKASISAIKASERNRYWNDSALSDWLNLLPRGRGIAGVTELPLPSKATPCMNPNLMH
ncbi:hypothetical protein EMCRGX_G004412 [Ephydatia muelleri]